MRLTDSDLVLLARMSKAINRTAYHGGLGRQESGKYIGVIDRILREHGTHVDALVDHKTWMTEDDEHPEGLRVPQPFRLLEADRKEEG